MGCRCSGLSKEHQDDVYGLNLGDLPASVTAVETNEKGFLDLHLAGIVQPGLMSKIERGLARRGFTLETAEMSFEQTFMTGVIKVKLPSTGLRDTASAEHGATEVLEVNIGFGSPAQSNRKRNSARLSTASATSIGSMSVAQVNTMGVSSTPSAFFDSANKAQPFMVYTQHTWGSYVRSALLEQIPGANDACMKLQVRSGSAQNGQSGQQHCEEAFWFRCTNTIAADLARQIGSKERMQAWLENSLIAMPPEMEPDENSSECSAGPPDDLLHALEARERKKRISRLKELPRAVARIARKIKYELREQDEFGVQFEGCTKYIGSGLVRSQSGNKNDSEASIVMIECTTLVIKSSHVEDNGATWLSQMSGTVSEMVCSVDTKGRRFCIKKCFLNDVLPSGKKAGAQLVAEQLYAPFNLWKNSSTATTSGKDAGGERWLVPLRDLAEIKLCDVVNWNTYAVLSEVLGMELGEHMRMSVNAELSRSKLPRLEECKELPLLHVFMKTCLGRLVLNIMDIWMEKSVGDTIALRDIKVETGSNSFEHIAGENRHPLDITLYLQSSIRLGPISSCPPSREALSPPMSPALLGSPEMVCHVSTTRSSSIAYQQSKHFSNLHEWLQGSAFPNLVQLVEQKRALLDVRMFLHGRWISQPHAASETEATEGAVIKDESIHTLNKDTIIDADAAMQHDGVYKLLSAVSRVVVHLQRERGASCLASASGMLGNPGPEGNADGQKLSAQRANVDAAILEALSTTRVDGQFLPQSFNDLIEKGDIQLQTTSKRLLLHRSYVDAVLSSRSKAGRGWVERFYDLAMSSDGFSVLIDVLLEWFLCGAHALAGPSDAIRADVIGLLSYLQEHLGQERAMVCARSEDSAALNRSPLLEDQASIEFFQRHVEQRRMICSLLLPSEVTAGFEAMSSTLNIMVSQNLKRHRQLIADTLGESPEFQGVFTSLEKMENLLLVHAGAKTSNQNESVERFDITTWWQSVTACIEACQTITDKLLLTLRPRGKNL